MGIMKCKGRDCIERKIYTHTYAHTHTHTHIHTHTYIHIHIRTYTHTVGLPYLLVLHSQIEPTVDQKYDKKI